MYLRIYSDQMKRKVWRSGNSWVVTIPNEVVEKFNLMNRKLIDFDIRNVFEETEKIFDNFFGDFGNNIIPSIKKSGDELDKISRFRQPLTDLKEKENEYVAVIEIPGIDKKDIELKISDSQLEVKVEKKSETKVSSEEEGFIGSERVYSGFYRLINLPSDVAPEKARANYKNGLLEVVLPKSFKSKKKKKTIKID